MNAGRTFIARYSRDDNGSWLVEALIHPTSERFGVATHGRTLTAAESNLREALALWFDIDDEQAFVLVPSYNLDAKILETASQAAVRRDEARRAEGEAVALMTMAGTQLVASGLSVRDVGTILGVSHQRVQQLVGGSSRNQAPPPKDGTQEVAAGVANLVTTPLGIGVMIGALSFLVVNGWLEFKKRKQERVLVPTRQQPECPPPSPQLAQVLSLVEYRARREGATIPEIAVAAGLSDADALKVETSLVEETN